MRYLILFSCCLSSFAWGQTVVHFQPKCKGAPLELEHKIEDLSIETFRFYISHVQLLYEDNVVWTEGNNPHLIDLEEVQSLTIQLNQSPLKFDAISFALGIDSLTNVSGVMGGDLDPTKGMYWSWQSGYINFKLEGTRSDSTNTSEFNYHLGGYSNERNCLQVVKLNTSCSDTIKIDFDINAFLMQIDPKLPNSIMSPSPQAVVISKIAASSFKVHESH